MSFSITIEDRGLQEALSRLQGRLGKISPLMQALGEDIMERTKQRFTVARGPDGQPWAANSPVTLARYLKQRGGMRKKDGGLSKRGQVALAGKRPLKGESGDLARQFFVRAGNDGVTIGNSAVYAAIQQFGGKKAQFPKLWGDIPARPFLPVTPQGGLYPEELARIVKTLQDFLQT